MALQMNFTKFGQQFPNAYVRVHRQFGSKQEGLTYNVRIYISRDTYQADINAHLDEKQFRMSYPDTPTTHYPDDAYAHLKTQDGFTEATDILEAGQVPSP